MTFIEDVAKALKSVPNTDRVFIATKPNHPKPDVIVHITDDYVFTVTVEQIAGP